MSAWTNCRDCGVALDRPNDDDDNGYCAFHSIMPKGLGELEQQLQPKQEGEEE